MVKLSVIVPVYNREKYIEECLNSLVNQTLKDIEFIIIDDASTDNSLNIIRNYAGDPRIKIYCNKQNKGQAYSRNFGIKIAKGEYIGFVDSDDYVDLKMYETMYNGAKENNADIVSCGINFVKNDFKNTESNVNPNWKGNLYQTAKNPEKIFWESPSCCNKIFKKDLIGNYKFLDFPLWEDITFTYSMLIKAKTVLSFPNNFYMYRKDITNGVSSRAYQIDTPLENIFIIADEIEKEAKRNHKYKIFKKIISLLKLSISLERLSEINYWNINEEEKNKIMIHFYQSVIKKYGSEKIVNEALLSSKVDLFLVDKVKEMIEEKHVK